MQEVEAEQEGSHDTAIQDGNTLTVEIIKCYILYLTSCYIIKTLIVMSSDDIGISKGIT